MLERVEGFIIKTQDYQETHKIVTIFSNKLGKFSALARGAKKPNSRMAAVTQPFIYGDFLIYLGKGLSTIQQGDIIQSYRSIRENIHKTTYAAYITELTDKLLPTKEPNSYVFKQFKHTLSWIEENEDVMIPTMMYELKLYKLGGFAPVVDHCVLCSSHDLKGTFSIAEGGFLCTACAKKDETATTLSPAFIKLLPIFINVGLEQVGTITIKKANKQRLRQILDEYYDQYGSYYLKTRNVLRQLDQL